MRSLRNLIMACAMWVMARLGLVPKEVDVIKAILGGDEARLRALLKPGVNVNFRLTLSEDQPEWTLLHIATGGQSPQIVRALLEHGADPNSGDSFGLTPLMMASMGGMLEILELLLTAGADPNITIPDKELDIPVSALGCAGVSAPEKREAVRAILLRHGATEAIGFSSQNGEVLINTFRDSSAAQLASSQARSTLDHFCDSYRNKNGEGHSVKVPLTDESQHVEHVWYRVLDIGESSLLGTLESEPVNVRRPLEPERQIPFNEINDWYYIKAKQMYGNFTLRVSLPHMEERQRQAWEEVLADL